MNAMIAQIRKDFPTLVRHDNGERPIHYLDNAATTLKPKVVLEAMEAYYIDYPSNIHRGSYDFSQKASEAYEEARAIVAEFVGVSDPSSILFTSGTTASSNLFARSFLSTLQKGDEILVTTLEHNSNLVNWQVLAKEYGLVLKYLPFSVTTGSFDLQALPSLLSPRTKLFSFTIASNTLGVVTPYLALIQMAKERGILCCLDVAQAVAHFPLKLEEWGADAAFFSGHKLFGPTGIGVLYMSKKLVRTLPPFFLGGGMIWELSRDQVVYADPPERFEAGTPPIAQAIGLAAAIRYMKKLGWGTILALEDFLWNRLRTLLEAIPGVILYATGRPHIGVLSFNVEGVHAHDVGTILNERHVAVRTGQHCTHLFMQEASIDSTVRASVALYNNEEDLVALVAGLQMVKEIFHV